MAFSSATPAALASDFGVASYMAGLGVVRVSMARDTDIDADGTILYLRFTVSGGASLVSLSAVQLNDAAGRDFVTSTLQKQIQVVAPRSVFLPVARR